MVFMMGFCVPYSVENYPNPKDDVVACGRNGASFLCDPDHVIQPWAADKIDKIISEIGLDRSDCSEGGPQIGVALMDKFILSGSVESTAKSFAKKLHDKWGVGQKSCNNGILFLLSKTDRYMYISTGKGIRNKLTDDYVQIIIDEMRQGLRKEKYSDTIVAAIEEIKQVIINDKKLSYANPGPNWTILFSFIVVSFGCIYFVYCKAYSPYAKCKRKLSEIDRQAKAKKFDHSSCPICLEDFPTSKSAKHIPLEILDCGHTFCKKCINDWFLSSRSEVCPVCREGSKDRSSLLLTDPLLEGEIQFRLASMHRIYPTYISNDMMSSWSSNSSCNFVSDFVSHHSTSSGSSSDWGGGGSCGGGGGGGGW